jgi:hypothetical protein
VGYFELCLLASGIFSIVVGLVLLCVGILLFVLALLMKIYRKIIMFEKRMLVLLFVVFISIWVYVGLTAQ